MTSENFKEIILWGFERNIISTRNDGSSANSHPGKVVRILRQKGLIHLNEKKQDYLYSIVAAFHDLIEDHQATYEEIKQVAGTEVADLVQILSKDPKLKNEDDYMQKYISKIAQNEVARLVKIADRIENITDFKGLKNKKAYIAETEKWFVDLAKGTVFEKDLNNALQILKNAVKEDETR